MSFVTPSTPSNGFNPGDPAKAYMSQRTMEPEISVPGQQFRNSGLMAIGAPSPTFDLKFTGPGDYPYVCYVHGEMMRGMVHVRAKGTTYPFHQRQYDAQARHAAAHVLADGYRLWARARARAAANPTHVYVGAMDDTAMLMRFVAPTVRIHTGHTVSFDMSLNDGFVPHTVTFGTEPDNIFAPVGDPAQFTGGDLNSGLLLPKAFVSALPGAKSTFEVTFKKAGTYHYICAFHDELGMVGDIIVS